MDDLGVDFKTASELMIKFKGYMKVKPIPRVGSSYKLRKDYMDELETYCMRNRVDKSAVIECLLMAFLDTREPVEPVTPPASSS